MIKRLSAPIIALIFACGIALVGIVQSYSQSLDLYKTRDALLMHKLGEPFAVFNPALKNVRIIGYFSDKNMDIPLALAQYQQAQFTLAPTILELNSLNHPIVIFDSTTPQKSIDLMKANGFKPIAATATGAFLAIKESEAKSP